MASNNLADLQAELKKQREKGGYSSPHERAITPPITVSCTCCHRNISCKEATLYTWPDRSGDGGNCGWVVSCTNCGNRMMPEKLNQLAPPPRKTSKAPFLLIGAGLILLVLVLVVHMFGGQQQNSNGNSTGTSGNSVNTTDTYEQEETATTDGGGQEDPVETETTDTNTADTEAVAEEDLVYTSHYQVIMEDATWDEAEEDCEGSIYTGDTGTVHGHLATITSQEEYEQVVDVLNTFIKEHGSAAEKIYYVWLGGWNSASDCERGINNYQWVTGEEWTFDVWCNAVTDDGIQIDEPSFIDEGNDNMLENRLILWGYKKDTLGWTFSDQNEDLPDVYDSAKGKIAYICEYDDCVLVN